MEAAGRELRATLLQHLCTQIGLKGPGLLLPSLLVPASTLHLQSSCNCTNCSQILSLHLHTKSHKYLVQLVAHTNPAMSSYRYGRPALKNSVDMQLQSAFSDGNWNTVIRLAAKRAATLKDPYYEVCNQSIR
jgi:hypothetical protein